MGYNAALDKAYNRLGEISDINNVSVGFFADEYVADIEKRTLTDADSGKIVPDFIAVLILHYLIKKIEGLPEETGKWISFKEMDGGEIYYPAFRKRAVEPVIRKYGANPEGLLLSIDRLGASNESAGDCSIKIYPLEGVPVLITVFGQDDEFPAEASVLFDRSIKNIFATEDAAVLAGLVASKIK
ncbi:DUF3786 domain-containing protein [bacterium]|nr:DUF3786 domain-containing protein [Candidatus Omnitrophota bacterium]MBU2528391.1 DUF3786 domain-containing protein [bacterium]MBU3930649.1 DUF3786 domain-containing protein [bacterium]MBU4122328.1 DUF3786 domain-containing protein [bacterium]